MYRIAICLCLVACANKHDSAPSNASASPPPPPPTMPKLAMQSTAAIDLPPIQHVQLMPMASREGSSTEVEQGVFVVKYQADDKTSADVMCRVDRYNLVYVDTGAHAGEVMYRPDPFTTVPHVCEARFHTGGSEPRACYRDGNLTAGPCPAGSFPAPAMPASSSIDFQLGGIVDHHDGALVVKGLFTLAQPLRDQTASFALRCESGHQVSSSKPDRGEHGVPLSRLGAGETLYTWSLTFFFEHAFAATPARCELTVVAGPRDAPSKDQHLGTFCLAGTTSTAGPCQPGLGG